MRLGLVLFILLGLCIWLAVAVLALDGEEPESYVKRLEKEIAKLKAEDWPTTLADLNAPPIADEENAAPLYDKAFAALPRRHEGDAFLEELSGIHPAWRATPERLTIVRDYLADNSQVIELLTQAARRKVC